MCAIINESLHCAHNKKGCRYCENDSSHNTGSPKIYASLLKLISNIVLAEHNGLIHQRSQSISKFYHNIKRTIRISSGLDRL